MPSFESAPEEKKKSDSKAVKWLKRATALGGAVAVGYLGGLKKAEPKMEAEQTGGDHTEEVTAHNTKEKTNRSSFSGYGISTETANGEVTQTSYGESKGGKKTFRGYGIER